MRKLFYLAIVLCLLTKTNLHAQSNKVTWGSTKMGKGVEYHEIELLSYKKELFNFKYKEGSKFIILNRISPEMDVVFSKKLKFKEDFQSEIFIKIHEREIYIFHLIKYVKNQKSELVSDIFSLEGVYIERKVVTQFDLPKKAIQHISFSTSPNKVLMAAIVKTRIKKGTVNLEFFNFGFESTNNIKKYNYNFVNEDNAQGVFLENFTIDNVGNYLFNTETFKRFVERKRSRLLCFNSNGELKIDKQFEGEMREYVDLEIQSTNSGVLHIIGSSRKINKGSNGFFLITVDEENCEIKNETFFYFTEEIFKNLFGFEVPSGGAVITEKKIIPKILIDKDGGGFIVAEMWWYDEGIYKGDLLTVRFDHSGNFGKWFVIKKESKARHSDFYNSLSYFGFIKNGELNLIYNDHIENLNLEMKPAKILRGPRNQNSVAVLLRINAKNLVSKDLLFKYLDYGSYLLPEHCRLINDRIILYTGSLNKVKLGILKTY